MKNRADAAGAGSAAIRAIALPETIELPPVLRAERFGERLRGLLGREALLEHSVLWIAPCCAIHTFGLARAIDAVFVDASGHVLRVDAWLGPRRLRYCPGAAGVLELPGGAAAQLGLDRGSVRLSGLG